MSIDFGTDIYEEPIVAKTFLSEDAQEGSLRPKTLREYIGQEKAKGNLAVFIEAAKRRNESLDHVLLHGPPGLGKTTLAGIIAAEMGVNIRITSGPAIESARAPARTPSGSTCRTSRSSARRPAPVSSPRRCATASASRCVWSFIRPRSLRRSSRARRAS